MTLRKSLPRLFATIVVLLTTACFADNPLLLDPFTADPTARVFDNQIYLHPSHDIPAPPGQRADWFYMADYHAFSSTNLLDWQYHGTIVSQDKVDWVDANSYSMWAPDCMEKEGKYYFYFPSQAKPSTAGEKGRRMIAQPPSRSLQRHQQEWCFRGFHRRSEKAGWLENGTRRGRRVDPV